LEENDVSEVMNREARIIGLLVGLLSLSVLMGNVAFAQGVVDRNMASIGAMTGHAEVIFTGEVAAVTRDPRGTTSSVRCTVGKVLKGAPLTEAVFKARTPGWEPKGSFLAFAVAQKGGRGLGLVGGHTFGFILLQEKTAQAYRETVAAHLAKDDPKARAAVLMRNFLGKVDRLRRDAAIDLFREAGLLPFLTAADRTALINTLDSETSRARFPQEIHALVDLSGRIGGDPAFKALVRFLRDPHALGFAGSLARAFEHMGRAAVVPDLLALFQGERESTALPTFIAVLAGLKVEGAMDRFVALAADGNERVRKFAILGIGDLGGSRAIEPLSSILTDEKRPFPERQLAVVALHQTGEAAGVRVICDTEEKTENPQLRAYIHKFRRHPARERRLLILQHAK
jgi:hypothetical protein